VLIFTKIRTNFLFDCSAEFYSVHAVNKYFYFRNLARHNDIGKKGEELAKHFLVQSGFNILEKNWRYRRLEVDFIAVKSEVVHFVEVKTRTSEHMGRPEDLVTDAKMESLIEASEVYTEQNPLYERVQFDILSILIQLNKTSYLLIEDVFI